MLVKICGVMDAEMAAYAVQEGAQFIGLLFSKVSSRAIDLETARGIVKTVRALGAEPVAVFADENFSEIGREALWTNCRLPRSMWLMESRFPHHSTRNGIISCLKS